MKPIRFALFMTFLIPPMCSAWLAQAHEGHTHVMGAVSSVSTSQLVVQTKDGHTETIQLDHNTRYRAAGVATSSATIQVGDRVVVEVTEEANGLRAAEVRYAPAAPRAP
ncbi:MAG: hypothetical protein HOP35_06215 [Nitrospira sp.]|nr:hypothetical protein [Nitrospira sp.]